MGETRHTCAVTASFGLESVVRGELEALGIAVQRTEDRRVFFQGTAREIARGNLRLRTAARVLIQVAEFPAPDFDSLYQGIRGIRWKDLLGSSPFVTVDARSVKSRLTAIPSLQSVAKKAIVDAIMGGRAGARTAARLLETGPRYEVELFLHADRASVCLDTTGPGLHKRGYRRGTGAAPLRETLAAALVLLSRWDPSRPLADPLCGSGTIPIEAALLAAGIAPGMGRTFAGESWPLLPASAWSEERDRARADAQLRKGSAAPIVGADRDGGMVKVAEANARSAGVAEIVTFRTAPLQSFRPEGDYGVIVCNPPYGERLGDARQAEALYREMGSLFRALPTWSLFALSAGEDFQKHFGARASRNRKLYNGNIRCWYYQYFGPLPR